MAKNRFSLYDKFRTNPSANMILSMPMAAGISKSDIAMGQSEKNKERVGFDENYDASQNTIGDITDVLGIAPLYDNNDRPTMPATGLTIPSSMFEDKKSNRPTMPATGMTIPSSAYMDNEEKEEEDEEGRPKGLFSFLDGVELDGDALIKAGRAIEKGEGLGGAIEAYNDEMKANQAAEVAKQEKEYDRKRQERLDELDMAVQENEIAYKQSQMTTDDQKLARDAAIAEAAAKDIPLDSKEFAAILSNKLDMILEGKKKENYLTIPGLQEGIALNTLGLGEYGDPLNTSAANQLQGGGLQSGGQMVIKATDIPGYDK